MHFDCHLIIRKLFFVKTLKKSQTDLPFDNFVSIMGKIGDLNFEWEHLGHLVKGLDQIAHGKEGFISIAVDNVFKLSLDQV